MVVLESVQTVLVTQMSDYARSSRNYAGLHAATMWATGHVALQMLQPYALVPRQFVEHMVCNFCYGKGGTFFLLFQRWRGAERCPWIDPAQLTCRRCGAWWIRQGHERPSVPCHRRLLPVEAGSRCRKVPPVEVGSCHRKCCPTKWCAGARRSCGHGPSSMHHGPKVESGGDILAETVDEVGGAATAVERPRAPSVPALPSPCGSAFAHRIGRAGSVAGGDGMG
jgi:hypothetical protein